MKKTDKKSSYAEAGVDINEMERGLKAVKKMVKRTARRGAMSDIGSFGGIFASPGKDHALVASTDGVGTKLKVAMMAGCHTTVGEDIVNHCVNDILVQGARPLFFMDYIGTSTLDSRIFRDILTGLCKACRENGCTLLGGETAEMPGLYPPGEYDLVGTIVGSVPKRKIITGRSITPGDIIIGLRSSGLHTNGFSLARKVIFESAGLKPTDTFPGADRSVASALLAVHKSYLNPATRVMKKIAVHGMAHITGGGVVDNIPRILPAGTHAVIDTSSWKPGPVFDFIEKQGKVDHEEMYRVFNMGIGFVFVVKEKDAGPTLGILKRMNYKPVLAGYIAEGNGRLKLM